jgi:hypothetical protein
VRGAGLFAAVAMNFFWGAAAASGPAEAQRGVLLLALDQRQGSSDAGLQRPTADCPRGCCGCACGFPVPASHGGYTVELEYDCVGVPTVLLGGRTQSLHKNGSMMCAHMLPVQPAGWQTTNGVSFPLREHTVKRSLMAGTVPRMTSVIPVLLRDGARGGGQQRHCPGPVCHPAGDARTCEGWRRRSTDGCIWWHQSGGTLLSCGDSRRHAVGPKSGCDPDDA